MPCAIACSALVVLVLSQTEGQLTDAAPIGNLILPATRLVKVEAMIVAETIAKQLEARINYRRALKMAIASGMRMGAEGIKIRVSGRIGGAEMARSEEYKQGRTPLHTWRADIDYGFYEALTVYGKIGVKVWICKGEVYGKRDLTQGLAGSLPDAGTNQGGDSRDGGRGDRDNRGGRDGDRRQPRQRAGGGAAGAGNRGGGKR